MTDSRCLPQGSDHRLASLIMYPQELLDMREDKLVARVINNSWSENVLSLTFQGSRDSV